MCECIIYTVYASVITFVYVCFKIINTILICYNILIGYNLINKLHYIYIYILNIIKFISKNIIKLN